MFSYLVDPVHNIDAVLVPADQPAVSQEAAEQPQLGLRGAVRSDRSRPGKHFQLRHLEDRQCFSHQGASGWEPV